MTLVEVISFTPDGKSIYEAHILEATIMHDDNNTEEGFVFIVSDSLSSPAMDHNLIPPFAMRESCVHAMATIRF